MSRTTSGSVKFDKIVEGIVDANLGPERSVRLIKKARALDIESQAKAAYKSRKYRSDSLPVLYGSAARLAFGTSHRRYEPKIFENARTVVVTGDGAYRRRRVRSARRKRSRYGSKRALLYRYLISKRIPKAVASSIAMETDGSPISQPFESQLGKRMKRDGYDDLNSL